MLIDTEVEGLPNSRERLINLDFADLVYFFPKVGVEQHHVGSIACGGVGGLLLLVNCPFALERTAAWLIPVGWYGEVILDQAILGQVGSKHATCITWGWVFGACGVVVIGGVTVVAFWSGIA